MRPGTADSGIADASPHLDFTMQWK